MVKDEGDNPMVKAEGDTTQWSTMKGRQPNGQKKIISSTFSFN
jgi:hypothetical protein